MDITVLISSLWKTGTNIICSSLLFMLIVLLNLVKSAHIWNKHHPIIMHMTYVWQLRKWVSENILHIIHIISVYVCVYYMYIYIYIFLNLGDTSLYVTRTCRRKAIWPHSWSLVSIFVLVIVLSKIVCWSFPSSWSLNNPFMKGIHF